MATLKELKGRIGSVASSEKITGAMKMISSAKMHKAEGALKRLVPFRNQIQSIIANLLTADTVFTSPLIEAREVKHLTVVALGSDDGLCGAYNVNMAKYVQEYLNGLFDSQPALTAVKVIPVGKKMAKALKRIQDPRVSIEQASELVNSKSEGEAVKNFTDLLKDSFLSGVTDCVEVAYMHYFSAGRQRPQADRLMPLEPSALAAGNVEATGRPYLFEPSAQDVFAAVIPMFMLSMMQEIFGQNRASEQAARVMAMQSASDNAKKLLESLQLEFNKLRQQSITTELLDIVGGQARD